jgi:mannosyl-oligosaccharide alpha-1,2-mannosidase
LQTNKQETIFLDKWEEALNGIRKRMLGISAENHYIFIGKLNGGVDSNLDSNMEHLVCFFAGTLAVAATEGKKASEIKMTEQQMRDLDLAEEFGRSCYEMYQQATTGLSPENVSWKQLTSSSPNASQDALKILEKHQAPPKTGKTRKYSSYTGTSKRLKSPLDSSKPQGQNKMDFFVSQANNYLRPETIESMFILYRITEKEEYREMGWRMFEAFEKYTKVESGGYTSLVCYCFDFCEILWWLIFTIYVCTNRALSCKPMHPRKTRWKHFSLVKHSNTFIYFLQTTLLFPWTSTSSTRKLILSLSSPSVMN